LLKHQKQLLLQAAPSSSSTPAQTPKKIAKKLVQRVQYSELQISDLQQQESVLTANIDLLQKNASQLKDNLSELETKNTDLQNKVRQTRFDEFVRKVPNTLLVSMHKKLYGSSSKISTSKGPKPKLILLDEINAKMPGQGLIKYIHDNLDEDEGLSDILDRYTASVTAGSEQEGSGLADGQPGLYNTDVTHLMHKYSSRGFLGTYSIDQLGTIQPGTRSSVLSFVMNTVPHNVKMGHFVAVFIDKKRCTLEYYDPLGQEPPKAFVKGIKAVLHKMGGFKQRLQFKINRIRFQSVRSDNCGYFAIRFLERRYKGWTFRRATGFDRHVMGIKNSEKSINLFRHRIEEFGHL